MPYISPDKRPRLDAVVHQLEAARQLSPGELNYLITKILLAVLPLYPSYTDYNTLLGVLEAVKHELYRRVILHYEEDKRTENGDVYDR